MGIVRVVTDSTADMDDVEASALGITTVPLNVHWNGETYLDKVEMSIDQFYRKLREGKETPKTSQPSAGQFEEVYRGLLKEADGVVSLHISSKLSGTLNSAQIASATVGRERVAVVDSETTSFALGWLAIATARAAARGASLSECVAIAAELAPRLRLYFVVDTLEYLRRGGRIGRAQAIAGGLLSVKPILEIAEGEVSPVDRVRTRAAALKRMAKVMAGLGALERVAVLYGDEQEPAEQLRALLLDAYPSIDIAWGRIGPVLGTHTGPGVVGACAVVAGEKARSD